MLVFSNVLEIIDVVVLVLVVVSGFVFTLVLVVSVDDGGYFTLFSVLYSGFLYSTTGFASIIKLIFSSFLCSSDCGMSPYSIGGGLGSVIVFHRSSSLFWATRTDFNRLEGNIFSGNGISVSRRVLSIFILLTFSSISKFILSSSGSSFRYPPLGISLEKAF